MYFVYMYVYARAGRTHTQTYAYMHMQVLFYSCTSSHAQRSLCLMEVLPPSRNICSRLRQNAFPNIPEGITPLSNTFCQTHFCHICLRQQGVHVPIPVLSQNSLCHRLEAAPIHVQDSFIQFLPLGAYTIQICCRERLQTMFLHCTLIVTSTSPKALVHPR